MTKIKVSYFDNVGDTKPKNFVLNTWLKNTINPPENLLKKVERYRKTGNASHKKSIPCVTISASFKTVRNLDDVKQETNLICLDIDKKENPFLNFEDVKKMFSKHDSVLYVGNSVSEKGIYVIISIDEKKPLIKYFKHFRKSLGSVGIFIDEACKDYTRLRFFSVDTNAHYNKKAVPFVLPKKVKPKKYKNKGIASKSDTEKVEAVIQLIESYAIDITTVYSDWFKIAGCLYNAFGENGREYFHRVSRYNHGYKRKDADKKFNNCTNMNKVNLNTFFYIADSYGIRY